MTTDVIEHVALPSAEPAQTPWIGVHTTKGRETATDAYYNNLYKLGATALNGSNANDYTVNKLSQNEQYCRRVFRGSWLARRLITVVAKEMIRGGIEIKGIPTDKIEALQAMWLDFGIEQRLEELIINGRLFGGAIAVIIVAGQNLATPLNIDRVTPESFMGIKVFDRWRLSTPIAYDPLTGLPTSYQLVVSMASADSSLEITKSIERENNSGFLQVHASRVIRFDGDYLPQMDFIDNQHWHASCLDAMIEVVNNYMTSSASLTSMSRNATIKVYKISNLVPKLAQSSGVGARGNLEDMLAKITVSAGVEGTTVIDADSSIDLLVQNFEGAVKANEKLAMDVCAQQGAPYTKIFGDSASGLNATGEGDARNWYDIIECERKRLYTGVMKLLKVQYRSLFGTAPPATMRFEFTPLWQLSDSEKATIAAQQTDAIVKAYQADAIPHRVAIEELRKMSETTGMFDSITDEDIDDAEEADNEPPEPVVGTVGAVETKEMEDNSGEAE